MTTQDIETTLVSGAYAGGGQVQFEIAGEWYKIRPEDLHKIITATKLPLVATMARKYKYLTVKESK